MELSHSYFMKLALKEAQKAFDDDEVPIGAIVVANNQIIGKGFNQSRRLNDPTAHAEVIAITAACNFLGSPILNEATLYVTVEPCLMCIGAIEHARIKELVYGCDEPKTGHSLRVKPTKKLSVVKGVESPEAMSLMKGFFVSKR